LLADYALVVVDTNVLCLHPLGDLHILSPRTALKELKKSLLHQAFNGEL
jgi:hypothetical protein